jgi:hypothetical protein
MTTAVIIGLMVTMATVNEFIILLRRLSMRRLHRRGLEYFFHLSLFIPDRDKRDKFRYEGGHLKAIAADKGGQALLKTANIGQDAGVVEASDKDAFITAAKTRQWEREKSVRTLA